jgi:serine-type D-Ala-D-Ala carboxypeptidase/endopeptidase (penicillin-binding protein 4)
VPINGITAEAGPTPVPLRSASGFREHWMFPAPRLARAGADWLPVGDPAMYAGEVFRGHCRSAGITLPAAEIADGPPAGGILAARQSPPLETIVQGMLRYSTNLTAEVLGLRASQARELDPAGIEASAAAMTDWTRSRYGLTRLRARSHSGLSDRSVWPVIDTVRLLAAVADGMLPGLLKEQSLPDAGGVRIAAKSGTLYFASGLAGYITKADRTLAFAIYSADLDRRSRLDPAQPAPPAGARGWAARARGLQQDLLREWVASCFPSKSPRPRPRPPRMP